MVDISTLLGRAGKATDTALQNPDVLNFLATIGESLDPEGVGGHLGRQAKRSVSSRQASKANERALQFSEDILTPAGQPGPRSIKRNNYGSTTLQVDPNTEVQPTSVPQPAKAQVIPDEMILNRQSVPTISPVMRRKVITRAKQRGINPITALNLVTYDLANVNEPHLSRYDPDSAIDYFAELSSSLGDENKALIAYRNSPGSEPDPDYLGNISAYTPYSKRALDEDDVRALAVQPDVSQMIASREGSIAPQADIASERVRDEVAKAVEPYRPRQAGADPTIFNDITPSQARGGLTERDLAGLTPSEQRQIVQSYIENRAVGADIAKELGVSQRSFSKAKIDAAKAISGSGLSKSDRQSLLDALKAASTSQEVEQIEIATANAPAPASAGVERDAIADELYDKRYYDLTQAQQIEVNKQVEARGGITAEVITNEDGTFVVNKRTNRAIRVTEAPSVPPRSSAVQPTPKTGGPSLATPSPSSEIDQFISSVSSDPNTSGPGQPLRGKAMTESQARAYGYGSRALQAESVTEELEKDPANRARIASIRSYINNKIEGLGNTGVVGYAGSAAAISGPLIRDTIQDISERDINSLTRRFGTATANRLLTLNSISRTASKAALGALVASILASTVAEPLAQSLRTNEEQQFIQAKLDFTAALLRRESGAAILASEYKDTDKRYFPQVGEGPPVIAQKRVARQHVIRLLQNEAGRPLLPPVRGLVAPPPQPKSPPTAEELITPAAPRPTTTPRAQRGDSNILNRALGAHTPQEIRAGQTDNVVRELMNMPDAELNTLLDKLVVSPSKRAAIRVRIKQLRDK